MTLISLLRFQDILTVVLALAIIVVSFFKWRFSYWKRKNLPFVEASIPFGSIPNPFTRKVPVYLLFKEFRDHFKSLGLKHGGIYVFSNPIYIPVDPEIVKDIMSTDFHHFTDRGFYYNERDDPLTVNLFNLEGHKWQNLRQKLTPTFTSGKLKLMFPTLLECSLQMKTAADAIIERGETIDIKELSACYSTDVIGSFGFGLECNSFKDPNSEFRRVSKKLFPRDLLSNLWISLSFNFPNLFRTLRIRVTPKDVTQFFTNIVKKTVTYREENNIERKDFVQLLLQLKNKEKTMTLQEMIPQCFVFFSAGFESSSSLMTFCLYELATNPEIQDKTRNEIETVLSKYEGNITYESVSDMKYLSQVVDETLRKHPIVPALPRIVTQDYKIPNEDIVLERGYKVWISTFSFHYDPEYFPDPEKFDPDRFSNENKAKIPPYVYMPFGLGPRICIGMRLGLIQAKVGLVALLRNYRFKVNKKTKTPLEYQRSSFILAFEGTILLDAEKIA